MTLIEDALTIGSYEAVRAKTNAQLEHLERLETEWLETGKEYTPCDCGVGYEGRLAGLPIEQVKGFAIAMDCVLGRLAILTTLFGVDSPIGDALHQVGHCRAAAVKLAGADYQEGENDWNDIPL